MDQLTHLAMNFLVILIVYRDSKAWKNYPAFLYLLSALAIDIDVVLIPVALWFPQYYYLTHRGILHSLIGSAIFMIFVFMIIHFTNLKNAFIRAFKLNKDTVKFNIFYPLLMIIGTWEHLIFDYITFQGVPFLMPFNSSLIRFAMFPFIDPIFFIMSLIYISSEFIFRIKIDYKRAIRLLYYSLVFILIAVRLVFYLNATMIGGIIAPDATIQVYGTSQPFNWIIIAQTDVPNTVNDTVEAYYYNVITSETVLLAKEYRVKYQSMNPNQTLSADNVTSMLDFLLNSYYYESVEWKTIFTLINVTWIPDENKWKVELFDFYEIAFFYYRNTTTVLTLNKMILLITPNYEVELLQNFI